MKDPIVQVGDPVLRMKAASVAQKDFGSPKLLKLIAKMREILSHEEFGVALAAPQIGESLRLFVVAGRSFAPESDELSVVEPVKTPVDRVFINPEITKYSRTKEEMNEGCLSVREKYGSVVRHEKVSLKAYDTTGKPFTYNASGLIAQIFQHECDHLDGTLYIDKAVTLRNEGRHAFKEPAKKDHA